MEQQIQASETPQNPVPEAPETAVETTPNDGGPVTQEADSGEKPTGESATPENANESEQQHKKSGFQKRIDRLNRQRQEVEQRAAALEAENQRLMAERLQTAQNSQEPTLEQYDWDSERWSAAYKDWVTKGIQEQQQAQLQAYERQQQDMRAYERSQEVARKSYEAQHKYPDFIQKVYDPSLPSLQDVNPEAFEAVIGSPHMADIAYYLANNPEEVYSFQGQNAVQSARAVLELESKFSAPAPTQITPNHPPPSEIKGGNDAPKDPLKMSMQEYRRWRMGGNK